VRAERGIIKETNDTFNSFSSVNLTLQCLAPKGSFRLERSKAARSIRFNACSPLLSEAYQRVVTLHLDSNCCRFIVIFDALSSAALKCERALKVAAGAS